MTKLQQWWLCSCMFWIFWGIAAWADGKWSIKTGALATLWMW